jgi:hypothetical protein
MQAINYNSLRKICKKPKTPLKKKKTTYTSSMSAHGVGKMPYGVMKGVTRCTVIQCNVFYYNNLTNIKVTLKPYKLTFIRRKNITSE